MPSRILLAEDNDEIRRLVSMVLRSDGHEVVAVPDGGQAIDSIRSDAFDAILLDLMMPVTSGWDVLQWTVEHHPHVAKSSLIVLTAAVHEARSIDSSTVFAIVTKPFDVMDLKALVRSCLESRAH